MTTEAPRTRCHWYRCPQCQQYCMCSDWRAFDLKAAAWGMDYLEALISLLEAEVLNQENPKGFWCGCCCVRHCLCRKHWSTLWASGWRSQFLKILTVAFIWSQNRHIHLCSRKEVSSDDTSIFWWACPPRDTWGWGEQPPCKWKKNYPGAQFQPSLAERK